MGVVTYLIGIIQVKYKASGAVNFLMTITPATHHERSIHMHIVTRKIQANKALEDDRPARERGGEED